MSDSITFFVPGIPRPGGSKRAFVRGGKAIVTEDCKRSKDWRALVALAAVEAGVKPMEGPLAFEIEFLFPRPKSHYRTGRHGGQLKDGAPRSHIVKPDLTKIVRSTEDALTGIVWRDDAQISQQHVRKWYVLPGEVPGAKITVTALATIELENGPPGCLRCSDCGRFQDEPFEYGDECVCGGTYKTLSEVTHEGS